jgi:Methyltransferase domain
MKSSAAKPSIHEQLGLDAAVSVELLKALHIVTPDARINQDSRRKLKQVQHLVRFITPLLDGLQHSGVSAPVLVDHGSGKNYLGFMLWDAWFRKHAGAVIGIDIRPDLVARSLELAQRMQAGNMRFVQANTQDALDHPELPAHVDVVTALHACDTATDDAIAFALHKAAAHLVLVPCCQAEVAAKLRQSKAFSGGARTALSELWRRPLHTREFGSQITNVLRCLQLEASGYQVSVTELVGWEHSMKNELIVASRHPDVPRGQAAKRLQALLDEIGLPQMRERFKPTQINSSFAIE